MQRVEAARKRTAHCVCRFSEFPRVKKLTLGSCSSYNAGAWGLPLLIYPAARPVRDAMAITYYKRFRMEVDLDRPVPPPFLPPSFWWVGWQEGFIDHHAEVKFLSFRDEVDSMVFPCLGDRLGCQRLMREIRRKPGFLPAATWLIACEEGYVAAVQGVTDRGWVGSIQNLGVVPSFRGLGLGRALVRQCLGGFRGAGLRRACLEVTAENASAVRMYREAGFRKAKTLYRAVDG